MAVHGILRSLPGAVAGEDLTTHQFRLVKLDTTGGVEPYTVVKADGTSSEPLLGVAFTNPVAGESVHVVIGGVVKVVTGTGGLDLGEDILSDANGAAVDGEGSGIGMVVKAAAVGAIAEVLIR